MRDAGGGGGGGGVDTEIPGSPGSIISAGEWLKGQLKSKAEAAGDAANDARRTASQGWDGPAGSGFTGSMSTARTAADDLASAAGSLGNALREFGDSLRACQSDMADVRREATGAGLSVAGFIVLDPGAGPERPTMPGPEATQPEVDAHNERVAAYNAHQELIRAYNRAAADAERADRRYSAACDSLQQRYDALDYLAQAITVVDVLGDTAAAALAANLNSAKSKLLTRALDLYDEAARAADDMANNMGRYTTRKWLFFKKFDADAYARDLGAIRSQMSQADDLVRQADNLTPGRLAQGLDVGGKALGAAGLGLGIYSDLQDGESATQAIVSQGGGMVASIAAGAAIGTMIPVPILGTAVGALGGAVVGLMADGAIDSLFENGPDVGAALDEAGEAVADAGGAIVDGVSSVGSAIGGLFD